MPLVPTFQLSEKTKGEITAALDGLPQHHRAQIVGVMASLSAEVEMYCRKKVLEDLRQEWAGTLATMLRSELRPS